MAVSFQSNPNNPSLIIEKEPKRWNYVQQKSANKSSKKLPKSFSMELKWLKSINPTNCLMRIPNSMMSIENTHNPWLSDFSETPRCFRSSTVKNPFLSDSSKSGKEFKTFSSLFTHQKFTAETPSNAQTWSSSFKINKQKGITIT